MQSSYAVIAAKSLSEEIARVIGEGYSDMNIINTTFNCAKDGNENYVTFTGVLLATSTHPISQLLNSVQKWVEDSQEIASLNVVVDGACSVRTSTLSSTCEARQVGALSSRGLSSNAAIDGLTAAFVIVLVIALCLVVVVVVLLVMFLKTKKSVSCPPSENAKVK